MNIRIRRFTAAAGVALFVLFIVSGIASATQISLLTPAGLNAGDHFRFAFVTSGSTAATATDIQTYNDFVQQQAGGATYDGAVVSWKAIGGSATVSARDNVGGFGTAVPVYLVNGTRIFQDMTGLPGGIWSYTLGIEAPLNVKIDGSSADAGNTWTGTGYRGGLANPGFLGDSYITVGRTDVTSSWYYYPNYPQSNLYPMFGISSELTVAAVPEIATSGLASAAALTVGFLSLLERRRNRSLNPGEPRPSMSRA